MASRDRFSAKLKCPECGREGIAEMSEEDGYRFMRDSTTIVENVTEGFRQVEAPSRLRSDLDFQCVDHPISALS